MPPPAASPTRSDRTAADVAATPRRTTGDDARSAGRLALVTIAGSALVAGLLEFAGLGIAARHGGTVDGSAFWATWASGTVRTLGGAIGLGVTTAGIAGLGWRRWRRPLRAVAAGFALGAMGLLAALALLTAWAP